MKTKNTLSVSEGRKNIFSIVDEVQKPNIYYTLTERGKPKAVIVSAEKFEYLTYQVSKELSKNVFGTLNQKERASWVKDNLRRNYIAENPQVFPKIFVIRDESKVVYLSDGKNQEELKHKEEELIKAQLYIKLIENLKYPLHCIELGRYVKIGGQESKRYVEADMLINNRDGNVNMIFEVSPFDDFEKNMDLVVGDLFDLAEALSFIKKPRYLVYYSKSSRRPNRDEKILVLDTMKYNSFRAWKKDGKKGMKEIPDICEDCSLEG